MKTFSSQITSISAFLSTSTCSWGFIFSFWEKLPKLLWKIGTETYSNASSVCADGSNSWLCTKECSLPISFFIFQILLFPFFYSFSLLGNRLIEHFFSVSSALLRTADRAQSQDGSYHIYVVYCFPGQTHSGHLFFCSKNKKKINSYMEVHSSTILFLPLAKAQFLKPREGLPDALLPTHSSLFTSGMERGFFNKALYITPLPN